MEGIPIPIEQQKTYIKMHEYATTERQHSFINEFYSISSYFLCKDKFVMDTIKLAEWLHIENDLLKYLVRSKLEEKKGYKQLKRGDKIKLSMFGVMDLLHDLHFDEANEVKRYIFEMMRAMRDVLIEIEIEITAGINV